MAENLISAILIYHPSLIPFSTSARTKCSHKSDPVLLAAMSFWESSFGRRVACGYANKRGVWLPANNILTNRIPYR